MNLQLTNISKSFGPTKALTRVSLNVRPGEVHALCGENGAGKSTLMNILGGNLRPDEGEIVIDGKQLTFHNPSEAFSAGISIVYQHLSLINSLSVAENIFANAQPINHFGFISYKALNEKTQALLDNLGFDLDPNRSVGILSPAAKQLTEIAKAVARRPQLLILDEPTASLGNSEKNLLFKLIRKLRSDGVSIIYISHKLNEVKEIADRISILKDGVHQGTFDNGALSEDALIRAMIGRDIDKSISNRPERGAIALSVMELTGQKFKNVSFELHEGEILGLAGLVGSGRTEIARAIFGIDAITSGNITVKNQNYSPSGPTEAIEQGIAYVPEDRKALGIFPHMSIRDNMIVSSARHLKKSLLFDPRQAISRTIEYIGRLKVVAPGGDTLVSHLSGGNQQKVLLARWLMTNPNILIVDEPTHGIDVGAKAEIYDLLRDLASKGKAILIISSELQELLTVCDRILVARNGSIVGEVNGTVATEETILSMATKGL